MKKVRITLKKGGNPWKLVVYDTPESALFLSEEEKQDTDDYRHVLVLEEGSTMEAEWLGSEWVYRDEVQTDQITKGREYVKYDKIRLGKLTPIDGPAHRTGYLRIYVGWVPGDVIPWATEGTRRGLKITPIIGKRRSKFDLSKLFVQDMTPQEELSAAAATNDSETSKSKKSDLN